MLLVTRLCCGDSGVEVDVDGRGAIHQLAAALTGQGACPERLAVGAENQAALAFCSVRRLEASLPERAVDVVDDSVMHARLRFCHSDLVFK